MPIYEFRCNQCRRKTSIFVRSMSSPINALCEHCGATDLARLFSRVAVMRSESDMFGGLDESALAGVDENDPRSVARWVRRMSREMGEPMDAEMQADLERMEAGQMPDDFDDGESDDFGDDFSEE